MVSGFIRQTAQSLNFDESCTKVILFAHVLSSDETTLTPRLFPWHYHRVCSYLGTLYILYQRKQDAHVYDRPQPLSFNFKAIV